jgi:hypothetical protein
LGSETAKNVVELSFCEMKLWRAICWQVQQNDATPLWEYEGVGGDGLTWSYEMAA